LGSLAGVRHEPCHAVKTAYWCRLRACHLSLDEWHIDLVIRPYGFNFSVGIIAEVKNPLSCLRSNVQAPHQRLYCTIGDLSLVLGTTFVARGRGGIGCFRSF
jgi:hypothetical protein